MVQQAQTRVSIGVYMLLSIIPFGSIYTTYKVGKLRLYLLIVIVGFIATTAVSVAAGLLSWVALLESGDVEGLLLESETVGPSFNAWLASNVPGIVFAFVLLYIQYRWFKGWNEKFDLSQHDDL